MASTLDGRGVTLLCIAGLRGALALVAIPLAPLLYEDHFLALVLLRPTKEVLLGAGFLIRDGRLAVTETILAAVPLAVLGVWAFFFIGRHFADRLDELPRPVARFLPPKRIDRLQAVVRRSGAKLVFLGRLAVFPSTLVAVAAGSSGMGRSLFLLADGAGAFASMGLVVGAGYGLGHAHDTAGPWMTVLGVAALVGMAVLIGRQLRSDEPADQDRKAVRA